MEPGYLTYLALLGLGTVLAVLGARRRRAQDAAPANDARPNPQIRAEPVSTRSARFKCGHRGPGTFRLNVYGERSRLVRSREQCDACMVEVMRREVIRCAACRFPIFPGEPVAAYLPGPGLHAAGSGTTPTGELLGCLRWGCCPTGALYSGNWSESGYRPAFGGDSLAGQVMSSGRMAVLNLGDGGRPEVWFQDGAAKEAGS